MAEQPTWDLRSTPTAKLLDMLHEYSQAHAAVSDSKGYTHPDSQHYAAHFYNLRWAVARELENRGYKFNLLPLVAKSLADLDHLRMDRPPVDRQYLLAKGLGPGERWITVHPHGDTEPGIPVLIRERPDGSAHIIGGAGGSLNFVKLTNLKSPEEYREHAKKQRAEKRQQEKERLAGMSPEDREAEATQKAKIDEDRRRQEDEQVAKVYQMMGYTPPVYEDPEALAARTGKDVAAAKLAISRERRAHITAVTQLAGALRDTLIDDHELAAEAGIGDLSIKGAADPELWGTGKTSMEVLQPDKPLETSGIKTDFSGRSRESGATGEGMKEESKLVKERAKKGQDLEQREFSERISENIQRWNEQAKELEATGQVKQNIMKIGELPEAGKMLDILKAERAIAQAGQEAREAKGQAKRGVQTNPYVVGTSDLDAAVVKKFSSEAELQAVRGLLGRVEDEEGLTKHVRNGSFDALNQVALTVSGGELLGREVVDFIGAAGAAQLMAQRLKNTLSDDDFEAISTAVQELHGRENANIAKESVEAADRELDFARQLESSEAEEGMDLLAARALNEQRMEHIAAAREILGDAYGRLEAMGSMSLALQGATKGDKEITCDMGGVPRDQAILMARSFGLTPEVSAEEAEAAGVDVEKMQGSETGDYRIESGAGKTYITLKPGALQKIVAAFDPKDTQEYLETQQIKQGRDDEEGWLPTGIERRPASTFDDPGYELNRFDSDLKLGEGMTPKDVRAALEDYVGAKMGEGYPFDRLRADMLSEEFRGRFIPPRFEHEFGQFTGEVFPRLDRSQVNPGDFQKAKQEADSQAEAQARQFSEDYKRRRGMTDDLVSLHSQRLSARENPEQFAEAAHRTLAGLPEAKVAFTKMGDLMPEDKTTLRNFYLKEFGQQKPLSAEEERLTARQKARDAEAAAQPKAAEPQAETPSMFGDEEIDTGGGIKINDEATQAKLKAAGTSAEAVQAENKQRVAEQNVAEAKAQGADEAPQEAQPRTPEQEAWDNYVQAMGGHQGAYETIQSILRGRTVEQFAGHYGKVFGRPLKIGQAELPNAGRHLQGQLPADKLKQVLGDRAAEAQSHMAKLASRSGGKFARENEAGDRRKAYDALKEMLKTDQGKLFMQDQFPSMDRPTIGQDAEAQLGSMWGNAAENFDAKKGKVDLVPDLAMHGKTIKQQRAIKLALRNRRLGLHMGAGSGKSVVSIGTFTEMHDKGMAKKAVFAVPSVVQGQFGSEMLRFTTPGKYNWLADPKATREERMAAYKDDGTHMIVATHHAFRDDLMHAVSQVSGQTPEAVSAGFAKMPEAARHAAMKDAMEKLGWKVDFFGADESHGLLNRQGKPDSSMAAALDSFSAHMPNYLSMTGTPVKNDASEAYDMLKKLDPARFTDRASFMRKYGSNTPANWASLQRLKARYTYSDRIASGVERFTDKREVKLHPEQQKAYSGVMSALNIVRRTRRKGDVDIDAVKQIAPDAFQDVPDEEHQRLANEIAKVGLGGRVNARLHSIVNGESYENNAKIDAVREDLQKHQDEPHVIFAHHYQSIDHLKKLCDEMGLKYGVISGDMSAAKKAAVRRGFQPAEGQEPQYNVLLNTDAGSTGQNLQRGSILMNYDTPDTAMTHEQRCARIDRLGQTQDVTVRDYFTDTPIERKARKRLDTKYQLSDVFQSPSERLDDTGLAAEIQRVKAEWGNAPQQQHEQLQAAQGAPEQSPPVPKPEAASAPPAGSLAGKVAKRAKAAKPAAPAPEAAAQPEAAPEAPAPQRQSGGGSQVAPSKAAQARRNRSNSQNAVNARQPSPSHVVHENNGEHHVIPKRPDGGYDIGNPVSKHGDEAEAYAEADRRNAEAGDKPLPFAPQPAPAAAPSEFETNLRGKMAAAKAKPEAAPAPEPSGSPREQAMAAHQAAKQAHDQAKAAHGDSLRKLTKEREAGSVSKETEALHQENAVRASAAEDQAAKLRPAARQAELEEGQERHAAYKKDKLKQARQESQARKQATQESNFNHLLGQAKTQGKVTDQNEPEIRRIAAAVGKLNPKDDPSRNLAHALAFGSLDRIKEAASGQGDLVANEPRFQQAAQQILDQLGKLKKSVRLWVRR